MAFDRFGLRELPEDKRDFQLGALYTLPPLTELPPHFELPALSIMNQGGTDFCTAYSTCAMSAIQEGVELYPPFSFAASKELSGNVEAWGQNLRDAHKAHQKYGALATKDTPESLKRLSNKEKRYFDNYGAEKTKALAYKKNSYFRVSGQYDHYDNIRASIWKFREKKQAVSIGVLFTWPLSQYILNTIGTTGFGHAMYIIGWNEDEGGLVVVNSYGESAGKDGYHILTRDVVNAFAGRYGAYMMVDIDRDTAEEGIKRREWYFASWWGKLKILFRDLWN